ncbi:ABC transporter permease [Oceanithermus sp.]
MSLATLFSAAFLIPLFQTTLRSTTVLLLTALGGMFSERSGVVNIALEGMIIFGALTAAVTAQLLEAPYLAKDPNAHIWWIPWVAVFFAMIVGAFVGWIHAVVSIKYKADQIISGTAINLLATGLPSLILAYFYNNTTASKEVVNRLPEWFGFSPLVYLAFALVPITWYIMFKTPWGLRLRSVGEHPEAADTMGINVFRTRYTAVIISGILASLAGAYLSIGLLNQFVRNMSAGQGFIALAALIFGKWHPLGVLGSTLLFGFAKALAIQLGGSNIMPPTIIEAFPFIITMLVLAGFVGSSRAPKAIGKPYEK